MLIEKRILAISQSISRVDWILAGIVWAVEYYFSLYLCFGFNVFFANAPNWSGGLFTSANHKRIPARFILIAASDALA